MAPRYVVAALGSQFINAPRGPLSTHRFRFMARRRMWEYKTSTPYMEFAVLDIFSIPEVLLDATIDKSMIKQRESTA